MNRENDKRIITSESVNIGHPDKTCDYIADSFLDEAIRQDSDSMMAVEVAIKNNHLFIYGEATTTAKIDYETIARERLREIGYTCNFEITKIISEQSREINSAVNREVITANDQGIVYGYACNETKEYMPLPITIAHKLMREYDKFRHTDDRFCPDAKSQVSIEYVGNDPVKIKTILLSVSHTENITNKEIFKIMRERVVLPVLEQYNEYTDENIEYIINPSGAFTIWGSFSDSGCVGRKIVVDTYGGVGRVGGGCFSSKNPTKVDRSGAYFARWVAKNIVANGLADKAELQLSFGIGLEKPISIYIDTFGTEKMPITKIKEIIENNFDFSVGNIIDTLELKKPIYSPTACFGHFGRDLFPWEKIIKLNI